MSLMMAGNMLIMSLADQLEEANKEIQRLRACLINNKKSVEETIKLAEATRKFLKHRSTNVECTSCTLSTVCSSSVLVKEHLEDATVDGKRFRLPVTSCSAGVLKCKTKKKSSKK